MGLDTDIRQIARDAAREVLREELKRIELALEADRMARRVPEPLLTVEGVAALCGVVPKTVQRWIARGLLRAMRSPGMREYRITQHDYEAFALGSPAPAPPSAPKDLDAEAARAVSAALSRGKRSR
jgi:excisionase family DNA binding protein